MSVESALGGMGGLGNFAGLGDSRFGFGNKIETEDYTSYSGDLAYQSQGIRPPNPVSRGKLVVESWSYDKDTDKVVFSGKYEDGSVGKVSQSYGNMKNLIFDENHLDAGFAAKVDTLLDRDGSITNCDFYGVSLGLSRFPEHIANSSFMDCNMCLSNFNSSHISNSRFVGCNLNDSIVSNAEFSNCKFEDSSLKRVDKSVAFKNCSFDNCGLDVPVEHGTHYSFNIFGYALGRSRVFDGIDDYHSEFDSGLSDSDERFDSSEDLSVVEDELGTLPSFDDLRNVAKLIRSVEHDSNDSFVSSDNKDCSLIGESSLLINSADFIDAKSNDKFDDSYNDTTKYDGLG